MISNEDKKSLDLINKLDKENMNLVAIVTNSFEKEENAEFNLDFYDYIESLNLSKNEEYLIQITPSLFLIKTDNSPDIIHTLLSTFIENHSMKNKLNLIVYKFDLNNFACTDNVADNIFKLIED